MAELVCRGCGKVVTATPPVPADYLCVKCSFQSWRNTPEPAQKDYKLSENDRIFLRVQRILPEV